MDSPSSIKTLENVHMKALITSHEKTRVIKISFKTLVGVRTRIRTGPILALLA